MLISELNQFRDEVAAPAMEKLLERTQVPDGYRCITELEISSLDGRSCGTDSVWKASGLTYCDGRAEVYQFEETDLSAEEFVQAHKDFVFLFEGKLHIYDELFPGEMNTEIGCLGKCAKLFEFLPDMKDLTIVTDTVPLLKLQQIMAQQAGPELFAPIDPDTQYIAVNRVMLLRERWSENESWCDEFWVDANRIPSIELFKAAVQDYLNTPHGRMDIKSTCEDFNWGDAVMYVPSEFWSKYGIFHQPTDQVNLAPTTNETITLKVDQDEILIPDSYYDHKDEFPSLDDVLSSVRQNKSNPSGTASKDDHDLEVF